MDEMVILSYNPCVTASNKLEYLETNYKEIEEQVG